MAKRDLYEEVTQSIIALLESGLKPWQRSWTSSSTIAGVPTNLSTHASYKGINTLILWAQQAHMSYSTDYWLTYKQAQALGGQVRKGEKSTTCVFFKPVAKEDKKTGEKSSYAMIKPFNVFNLDQIDGIEAPAPFYGPLYKTPLLQHVEQLGAQVDHGGDQACFIPSVDRIKMPQNSDFSSITHYDSILAHEVTHWTGHKSRLDRDLNNRFGSSAYAVEELIAEMGSAFISAHFGIEALHEHNATYLQSWLNVLKDDKRAIFAITSQARQACEFVIAEPQQKEVAA